MVGLNVVFWILVILFALIGMTRGWAKEILVTFSVILALFIIAVVEEFGPFQVPADTVMTTTQFWIRIGLLLALVLFGYQTPNIPRIAVSGRFARDRLQDSLLGFVLGFFNGYLIWGTIWFYLNQAGYPFETIFFPAPAGSPIEASIAQLLRILPPTWLGVPLIYFAVAIAFAFVLVVFI